MGWGSSSLARAEGTDAEQPICTKNYCQGKSKKDEERTVSLSGGCCKSGGRFMLLRSFTRLFIDMQAVPPCLHKHTRDQLTAWLTSWHLDGGTYNLIDLPVFLGDLILFRLTFYGYRLLSLCILPAGTGVPPSGLHTNHWSYKLTTAPEGVFLEQEPKERKERLHTYTYVPPKKKINPASSFVLHHQAPTVYRCK